MTDLFDGQPQGAPEFAVLNMGDWGEIFAGQEPAVDLADRDQLYQILDRR